MQRLGLFAVAGYLAGLIEATVRRRGGREPTPGALYADSHDGRFLGGVALPGHCRTASAGWFRAAAASWMRPWPQPWNLGDFGP